MLVLGIYGGYKNKISIGIVGGLGPETTSKFYLKLVKRIRKMYNQYPSIIIDSISFPVKLEKDIIIRSKNEERMLPILRDSIRKLNAAGCGFIVVPCNTVHIFIEEIKKTSEISIINIVDETVRYVRKCKYKKVGLLATNKTIEDKLYEKPLKRGYIDLILPLKKEQLKVSKIITKILERKTSKKDKQILERIINSMIKRDAEAIILGCTDLQLLIGGRMKVELIDTLNVLLEATLEMYKNKIKESYLLGVSYG